MSKGSTGMNVGGSSILVIFVLLCLTTFATLSMVSANADYKLTKKSQNSISAFYSADSAAEQKLAKISTALMGDFSMSSGGLQLTNTVASEEGLAIAQTPQGETQINFAIHISDIQELYVELVASPHIAAGTGKPCKIAVWQVRNTSEFDLEGEGLNLFGEEELNLFAG